MNEEFNVTLSGIKNETINDVKLAIRYGYSYRKIAQAQYNKTSKLIRGLIFFLYISIQNSDAIVSESNHHISSPQVDLFENNYRYKEK